jgi:hypothetical protein
MSWILVLRSFILDGSVGRVVQKQIPWASPQQVEKTRELQARQILELDSDTHQILALFTSVSDLLRQEQFSFKRHRNIFSCSTVLTK